MKDPRTRINEIVNELKDEYIAKILKNSPNLIPIVGPFVPIEEMLGIRNEAVVRYLQEQWYLETHKQPAERLGTVVPDLLRDGARDGEPGEAGEGGGGDQGEQHQHSAPRG